MTLSPLLKPFVLIVFLALLLLYLAFQHSPHLLPFVPYAIILLCPLMHLFMHRSHGIPARTTPEEP
jgi:hypothetical protein